MSVAERLARRRPPPRRRGDDQTVGIADFVKRTDLAAGTKPALLTSRACRARAQRFRGLYLRRFPHAGEKGKDDPMTESYRFFALHITQHASAPALLSRLHPACPLTRRRLFSAGLASTAARVRGARGGPLGASRRRAPRAGFALLGQRLRWRGAAVHRWPATWHRPFSAPAFA